MKRFNTFLLKENKEETWGQWGKRKAGEIVQRVSEVDPLVQKKAFLDGEIEDEMSHLKAIDKRLGKVKNPIVRKRLETDYNKTQEKIDKISFDLAAMSTASELGGAVAAVIPTGVSQVAGAAAYGAGIAGNIYSGVSDIRSGIGDIKQALRTTEPGARWTEGLEGAKRIGLGALNIGLSAVPFYGAVLKAPRTAAKAAKETTSAMGVGSEIAAAETKAARLKKIEAAARQVAKAKAKEKAILQTPLPPRDTYGGVPKSRAGFVTPTTPTDYDVAMAARTKVAEKVSKGEAKVAGLKNAPDEVARAKARTEAAAAKAAAAAFAKTQKNALLKAQVAKVMSPITIPRKLLGGALGGAVGGGVAGAIGTLADAIKGGGMGGRGDGEGSGTPQFVSGLSPLGGNVGRIK